MGAAEMAASSGADLGSSHALTSVIPTQRFQESALHATAEMLLQLQDSHPAISAFIR
jgi:hypothetical protein